MFAIVKTGGKQIKVSVDQRVSVEKLMVKVGDEVLLDQVLMICDGETVSLGAPFVANASVKATVEDQMRTKKIIIFKKKRRQNYRRKNGHRQHQTVLRIVEILANGKALKAKSTPKPEVAVTPEVKAKEPKAKPEKKVAS